MMIAAAAAAAEAEAAERRGEWRTPERLVASGLAGSPAGVRPFGTDTPHMRSKRPSADGATNLPRAQCIGTKSTTRDGMVGEGSSGREGAASERSLEKTPKLPPIQLSGHPAIFGKKTEQPQEKRNGTSEKKFPRESSRQSGYRNIIPALLVDTIVRQSP